MAQNKNPMIDTVLEFLNTHTNNKTVFKITQGARYRQRDPVYTELGVYNGITKKYTVYPVELLDKAAFEDIKVVALTTKK